MNILKLMAVKSVEKRRGDFRDRLRAGVPDGGGLDAVALQVQRASEEIGFFYLSGHGVPPAVVDAAFEASREFHALPLGEKTRLGLNENNIGYLAVNQSIQGASTVHKATRPNYNESFFISHDRVADH
jgi:isopenicillin N synthase-like dioxygenase